MSKEELLLMWAMSNHLFIFFVKIKHDYNIPEGGCNHYCFCVFTPSFCLEKHVQQQHLLYGC